MLPSASFDGRFRSGPQMESSSSNSHDTSLSRPTICPVAYGYMIDTPVIFTQGARLPRLHSHGEMHLILRLGVGAQVCSLRQLACCTPHLAQMPPVHSNKPLLSRLGRQGFCRVQIDQSTYSPTEHSLTSRYSKRARFDFRLSGRRPINAAGPKWECLLPCFSRRSPQPSSTCAC